MFERIATSILQRQFLVSELIRVACSHHNFRDIVAQGGNGTAGRILVFSRVITFLGERLPDGIYMLLVHNAAVVIHFQLHLGYQHQSYCQTDSQRNDFDKGSLALGKYVHNNTPLFCFNTFYGIGSDGLDDLEADGEDGYQQGKSTGGCEDPGA